MATGDLPVDESLIDPSKLLNTVLGKETDVTGTTGQNTTGSTTGVSSQTGSNTSNVSGSSTQGTQGTTTTTGSQSTTGTIGTNTSTTGATTNVDAVTANIKRLEDVYKRQAAGITPEMLSAIFTEGSKAAPNLLLANSNALGARAVGNTAVSQSLNQLNTNMVNKAADVNTQMLKDAGDTANQIAGFTKTTTSAGTTTQKSLSEQVQDLLTQNSSTAIVDQIVNMINKSNTTGTNTQAGTTAGTQTQNSTGTSSQNTSSTINTDVAKSLGGMIAAGVGIDQVFRLATEKGFVGNLKDFANMLKSTAGSLGTAATSYFDSPSFLAAAGSDYSNETNSWDSFFGDTADGGWFDLADGGKVPGYADGGLPEQVPFLPIKDLNAKQQGAKEDTSLEAMLMSMMGGGQQASGGGNTSSGSNTPSGGGTPGIGKIIKTGKDLYEAATGAAIAGGGLSTAGVPAVVTGLGATGLGAGAAAGVEGLATAAMGTGLAGTGLGSAAGTGLTLGTAGGGLSTAGVPAVASSLAETGLGGAAGFTGFAGAVPAIGAFLAATQIGSALFNRGVPERRAAAKRDWEASNPGKGSYEEHLQRDVVPELQKIFYGEEEKPADSGYQNTSDGGLADGGEVGEASLDHETTEPASEDIDEILNVFGITRGTDKGSLMFNTDALKKMSKVLGSSAKAPGYSNGGQINGPGTGISDSIPAKVQGGNPINVSAGEYVIPADVVQKFGAEAFDQLIAQHHVPADMQRAIIGE